MDTEKENSKPDYFTLSTINNAIDSLETCRNFLLSESEFKWKWIGASLLHSLYMFCIDTLERGNYDNVLTNNENEDNERYVLMGNDTRWKRSRKVYRKNNNGYTIIWDYINDEPPLTKNEGSKSEDNRRLISFWTALARVQDEEVDGPKYTFTDPFQLNEEQWKSLEWLYNIVDKIIYFVPCNSSISEDIFKVNIQRIIPVLENIAYQSYNVHFGEEFTRDHIKMLIEDIKNILDSKIIEVKKSIARDSLEEYSNESKNVIEVYSEGNNNIYLNKAKEFFYPNMNVDFRCYGGKNELQRHFKIMTKNKTKTKTIFVFDCDAETEHKDCESNKTDKMKPLIIPRNKRNVKVSSGIENLFERKLFDKKFYIEKKVTLKDGGSNLNFSLNKEKFCEFICKERNSKNDFINFKPLLEKIQEIIDK